MDIIDLDIGIENTWTLLRELDYLHSFGSCNFTRPGIRLKAERQEVVSWESYVLKFAPSSSLFHFIRDPVRV